MSTEGSLDDSIPFQDPEEKRHFLQIIEAFNAYERCAFYGLHRSMKYWHQLSVEQRQLVPAKTQSFMAQRMAITQNHSFIQQIIAPHRLMSSEMMDDASELPSTISDLEIDKVRSTLRTFVRDWAKEGQEERDQCHAPLLEELQKYFPRPSGGIHVLVPGAGLGRLAFDIARMGYSCQGNEFSYYMLLASNFVLNRTETLEQFLIYPFVHNTCNVVATADQIRPIRIPDVLPTDIPEGTDFSMCGGEFCEIYKQQPGAFHSIVTCFFIDTAKNIIDYIETIHTALVDGGVWINNGPLLYHFADMDTEPSIELSWEELRSVIVQFGFVIEREEDRVTNYTNNVRSMMRTVYTSKMFTAVKRGPSPIRSQTFEE